MICVEQTKIGADGNCHAACVASIFEVPLDSLPFPTADEMQSVESWQAYHERLENLFFRPRNLSQVCALYTTPNWHPPGYAILSTRNAQGGLHAVVAHSGRVVWNPHPDREFWELGEPHDWVFFAVIDPSQPVNLPSQNFNSSLDGADKEI